MIKTLLFVLGFIILAAVIGGAICFGVKYYHESNSYEDPKVALDKAYQKEKNRIESEYGWSYSSSDNAAKAIQKLDEKYQTELAKLSNSKKSKPRKTGLLATVIASVVMLAFVIMVPGSFHQVEAGTYAVVKDVGKIVDVRTPGTYFDFYMTRKYEVYDATVQQVKINTAAYSKDGQTMDLEVYLQYQIQLDKLVIRDANGDIVQTEGIAGKYVTLQSLQDRIETQCIEKTKAVMSSAEAMTIIKDRAKYSEDVSSTVRAAIGPDYYVNVQDVVLTNIDFTDEFEKSVEAKVVAEQEKQAAITKAEAELEVARLEAERKLVEAQGDAAAQLAIAEAQAKAAAYKIVELARTLGFPIQTSYVYTENGFRKVYDTPQVEMETLTYIGEQYIITYDADHTKEDLDKLVISYLEYLAYLEQWNGELPEVVSGDNGLSIIVPGGGNN